MEGGVKISGRGRDRERPEVQAYPLEAKTLIAIQDYLKAPGNGTDPTHSLFQTLGKHGPYQERGLTHKSVDCLIRSVVKKF
jgi:hypothetical protein